MHNIWCIVFSKSVWCCMRYNTTLLLQNMLMDMMLCMFKRWEARQTEATPCRKDACRESIHGKVVRTLYLRLEHVQRATASMVSPTALYDCAATSFHNDERLCYA